MHAVVHLSAARELQIQIASSLVVRARAEREGKSLPRLITRLLMCIMMYDAVFSIYELVRVRTTSLCLALELSAPRLVS